jgi:hypothetical protein
MLQLPRSPHGDDAGEEFFTIEPPVRLAIVSVPLSAITSRATSAAVRDRCVAANTAAGANAAVDAT